MKTISTSNGIGGSRTQLDILEIKRKLQEKSKKLSLDNFVNKETDNITSDIFSRLQRNNKKPALLIHQKLSREKERELDIHKIHKKTISKEIHNRLVRKTEDEIAKETEEVYDDDDDPEDIDNDEQSNRHEDEEDDSDFEEEKSLNKVETKNSTPEKPQSHTANYTIFIKNLPDIIYTSSLKALFNDASRILGHSIEKGKAEVTFSSKGAAEQEISSLKGKNYLGKALIAGFVEDLNREKDNTVPQRDKAIPIVKRAKDTQYIKEEAPKVKTERSVQTIKRTEIPTNKMIIDKIEITGKGGAVSIRDRLKKKH